MIFGGASLASVGLGSVLVDPGNIVDPTSLQAITTELNGVRVFPQMSTLQIQDTLGQPVTASFTLIDPLIVPVEGDRVRMLFHSQVIFGGTIDRVQKTTAGLAVSYYLCECLDWSQILLRRMLRRNFTNLPVQNILDSILDNELAGEPVTIGTIDSRFTVPLVDANNARIFDVCRTVAGATGQTFYVDFDQSIQMRSTTVPVSPITLTESVVQIEGTTVQSDRETYRNRQIVVVTGTPLPNSNIDALTVLVERSNDDQIVERQAIEGGTGLYESIEEVTHPTSNDGADLALLGIGYANLRLATSGTLRRTVSCTVRSYGFRAGQIASVNLPTFGIVGTYVIQRVSIREEDGTKLVHDLELTSSSLQQRAYESWLSIVKAGKVIVQVPSSFTNNLQTFNTPGADTWTVPAGVTTVEFTCYGGSGGGGGGAYSFSSFFSRTRTATGGRGGNAGKAITVLTVMEGQVFDLTIGAAGTAGTLASISGVSPPLVATAGNGTSGTLSSVVRSAVTYCQGNGGTYGTGGVADAWFNTATNGVDGNGGSGIGDAVSVGGGTTGGNSGTGAPTAGGPGIDGRIEVRW